MVVMVGMVGMVGMILVLDVVFVEADVIRRQVFHLGKVSWLHGRKAMTSVSL